MDVCKPFGLSGQMCGKGQVGPGVQHHPFPPVHAGIGSWRPGPAPSHSSCAGIESQDPAPPTLGSMVQSLGFLVGLEIWQSGSGGTAFPPPNFWTHGEPPGSGNERSSNMGNAGCLVMAKEVTFT